jgi:REP-associated tyrosine transposase
MPRTARASVGDICYHVINRGNARATVFHDDVDFAAFLELMNDPGAVPPMRIAGFCLMPNHFHLVLWPRADGDLSRWMQRLLTAHVRRHHRRHRTDGHLWQGRFKAFPIQKDAHLLTVLRYVERNPVRARLVGRAQDWRWSSLAANGPASESPRRSPLRLPEDWTDYVNSAQTAEELETLRNNVNRGAPFGGDRWVRRTAQRLGLNSTLRPRGRPRKPAE